MGREKDLSCSIRFLNSARYGVMLDEGTGKIAMASGAVCFNSRLTQRFFSILPPSISTLLPTWVLALEGNDNGRRVNASRLMYF